MKQLRLFKDWDADGIIYPYLEGRQHWSEASDDSWASYGVFLPSKEDAETFANAFKCKIKDYQPKDSVDND